MNKYFISFIFVLLLIPTVFSYGILNLEFAGIDSNNILKFNPMNYNKDIIVENKVQINNNQVVDKSRIQTKKEEVKITLAQVTYTQSNLKTMLSSDRTKSYIKGFGYDCIYINTDKNANFTLFFNIETGDLTKVELGDNCNRDIYLEESLIIDIRQNGFSASNIKNYLSKVDLPTNMYFKAIKVFTIG